MIPLNDPRLDRYAARGATQVNELCRRWKIPVEVGRDVIKLALFDIILFIGTRISLFLWLGAYNVTRRQRVDEIL